MEPGQNRAAWLKDARWGVFTHYLVGAEVTADEWNRRVDRLNVQGLADQLSSIGAPYYFMTLGQNSGHYCAPNASYDRFVGIQPSKCSRRDLIGDLYEALNPLGIKLLVYLPSGAPDQDPVAMEKLKWRSVPYGGKIGDRLAEFQSMWEAVIREWSLRWGSRVLGWWFDGCYFADEMYADPTPPNFESFAAAARAGNPNSIVAFNPGVLDPVTTITEHEDYTAGEISDPSKVVCPGQWVGRAQFHMLSYLGAEWCKKPARFTDEQVLDYTRRIVDRGGAVTWDVPIEPSGLIPEPFVTQLQALGEGLS